MQVRITPLAILTGFVYLAVVLDAWSRRAIRVAGAKLFFLPPYSPDLNPIEQTFVKIKHWVHAAQNAPFQRLGATSVNSSKPSSRQNAQTTSKTPVTLPSKYKTL